jgi:hypothetical protein
MTKHLICNRRFLHHYYLSGAYKKGGPFVFCNSEVKVHVLNTRYTTNGELFLKTNEIILLNITEEKFYEAYVEKSPYETFIIEKLVKLPRTIVLY